MERPFGMFFFCLQILIYVRNTDINFLEANINGPQISGPFKDFKIQYNNVIEILSVCAMIKFSRRNLIVKNRD